MIDLSQFVGKEVEVTYRGNGTGKGYITKKKTGYGGTHPYKFNSFGYDQWGNFYGPKSNHHLDIIKIEEIKPMIDLSKFVDKKVRVTFRNGETYEGEIQTTQSYTIYPYSFNYHRYSYGAAKSPYTKLGKFWSGSVSKLDIIKIEEIKPMNKYEELEKKVAEMQKEIDRLKKEEIVHPKIKSVRVTRTVVYDPKDDYLTFCNECEFVPSQDGFIDYLKEYFYDDFHRVPIFEQTIEEIDE
jgi:hypothetical protein